MRAAIITTNPDEPIRVEEVAEDLDALQGAVGSDFQIISIRGLNALMVLAEDGKLRGFELNERASTLAWWFESISTSDFIVGDVLLTGGYTEDGDLGDLTDASLKHIIELLGGLPEASTAVPAEGAS